MISLTVNVNAGSDIEGTFKQSIDLAKKLGCTVNFIFNGVTCFAFPDGDINEGVINYEKAIASKHKYKFARS